VNVKSTSVFNSSNRNSRTNSISLGFNNSTTTWQQQ
jgi:hypothetical protein